MPSPSFLTTKVYICLWVICLGSVVNVNGLHPPYMSIRHRSLVIARADAPPACIAKASLNSSTTGNSTSTSGFNVGGVNGTIPSNITTTSILPPTTTSSSNVTDSTSDAAGSAINATATGVPSLPGGSSTADNATSADNATATDDNITSDLRRRIAQFDLPDVALAWQELCLASGGASVFTPTGEDSPCVLMAGINGINALLANADPCAQQDNADAMIDFANTAGVTNRDVLVEFAIAYRKHPRNALNVLGVVPSTPYCQRAPRNSELNQVVNDQLEGVDPGVFGGPNSDVVPFGAPGTCPFGQTPDVSSCSCLSDNSTDVSAGFNSTSSSNPAANTTFPNLPSNSTSSATPVALNGTNVESGPSVPASSVGVNTTGLVNATSSTAALSATNIPSANPTLLFNATLPTGAPGDS